MSWREIASRWLEERARELDAPALTWILQCAAWNLLQCYPPGQGMDVVWLAVRTVI